MHKTIIKNGNKYIARITFDFNNKTYSHQKTCVNKEEAEEYVNSFVECDNFEDKILFEILILTYEIDKANNLTSLQDDRCAIRTLKPLWTTKIKDFNYSLFQKFANKTYIYDKEKTFINKVVKEIQKEIPTFRDFTPFIIYKKTRD